MTAVVEVDVFAEAAATLGEGPAWDAERGVLSWVDITAGAVHVFSESGEALQRHEVGHAVGAALPTGDGGFLLADELGFGLLSSDGTPSRVLDLLADRPNMQFNDAKCDPAGRAFAGSMASDMRPRSGNLYRLDPGPSAAPLLSDLTVSNGLGWSPDGATMWFTDSAWARVAGFDYDLDTGRIGRQHTSIEITDTAAVSDGLCVDDAGCIWVALWGGHEVRRYTPAGQLDATVQLPVAQVTSCAFGGRDRSKLFITTARSGMSADAIQAAPLAGALFVADTNATGAAATPWRHLDGV